MSYPPVIGDFTFNPKATAWSEQWEETGGKDARIIRIHGFLDREAPDPDTPAPLEALLAAASGEDPTALRLRPGRQLWVTRRRFTQAAHGRYAAFTLELEAAHQFEEATEPLAMPWDTIADGPVLMTLNPGTAAAPIIIEMTALEDIAEPAFTDGTRTLHYEGLVLAGQTLRFDGEARKLLRGDDDLSPYTQGIFPEAAPGITAITFAHHASEGQAATINLQFRPRWW